MKAKVSVVISACNEEKKIQDCLESVKWAEEIIFIDNSSTDKTVQIAKKYTSKIFTRPNNQMLNINKNYGFLKATHDWILNLDADERVLPQLAEEIKKITDSPDKKVGYWIPRKNIIFGKWIEHTGWYPDYQLRLFKKGVGQFPEEHVHEMIKVSGETEYLKENLIHYNYETVPQFLQKLEDIYVPNESEQLIKDGYIFNYLDAIRFPLKEFLSRFFAREGYKDGFHGLMLSLFMSFYHFIVFASIWEKQKFKDISNKNLLTEAEEEIKKSYKEIMFWFLTKKREDTKNLVKKTWLRLKLK